PRRAILDHRPGSQPWSKIPPSPPTCAMRPPDAQLRPRVLSLYFPHSRCLQ
ncbi:hypothetical protein FIBSPDRAFT_872272, partial [Athelia psychrophila]